MKDRLKAWLIERVKRRTAIAPPYELRYRHIFVMPTLFGCGFGGMLIFTALGGLNFNNNMALLMVFVLAALAAMTTLLAYRDLAGLRVEAIRGAPAFAGEPVHFRIHLSNPEERRRFSLQAALATAPGGDCTDADAGAGATLELPVATQGRGWLEPPPFRIETRYPLGLFRAWSWVFPATRCLVWPRPAAHPPPLPQTGEGNRGRARKDEGDQVHGLRNYRRGDPLRRVAWRTSARHDNLYTREMEHPQDEACVLDWDVLRGADAETRIAILTAWVLMADHRQLDWRLELPGQPPLAGTGPGHRARCLEALALYGL